MANPRDVKKIPITWTNGLSQPIKVSDFRDIGLTIAGDGSVQVLGSKEKYAATDDSVDFAATASITNSYAAIVIADETLANTYTTTLVVAGGAVKLGEVNTNLMTFVCLSRSGEGVDAFITVCDNS